MKIEWLRSVLAVARTGSFSEAAEAVSYVQSSVSRHVRCAEDELGVTLFNRASNSNTVRITDEGSALMDSIERVVNDYEALRLRAEDLGSRKQTPLSLGLDSYTFSSSSRATLLSLLYAEHPEILLTIKEFNSRERMEALIASKADAFLFSTPYYYGEPIEAVNDPLIRSVALWKMPLYFAFGADCAPASGSMALSELDGRKIFFYTDVLKNYDPENVTSRHGMLVKALLDRGVKPDIQIVDRHFADIKLTLTAQGKGVFPCMIPAFLRDYPGIKYVEVSDSPYYVQYYLIFLRKNKNPALATLTEFLEKTVQNRGT